jgi:hypothetical protein
MKKWSARGLVGDTAGDALSDNIKRLHLIHLDPLNSLFQPDEQFNKEFVKIENKQKKREMECQVWPLDNSEQRNFTETPL